MSKDIKYLKLATCGAKIFSTCDSRKYMAIVVDDMGHVVGIGYNGSPKGMAHCDQGGCPRLNQKVDRGSNYDNCVAIHAEQNALLHSDYTARRRGGTIYVNGPPCFTCAKLISNSGIKRLVFLYDPEYKQWPEVHAFLIESGVYSVSYTKEELDIFPVM
jgi:dCMP deaminase